MKLHTLSGQQNHRCAYCGFEMFFTANEASKRLAPLVRQMGRKARKNLRKAAIGRCASSDHVIPKCDGGSMDYENSVAACKFCNEFKGNHPASHAFKRIQRMLTKKTHPHQTFEDRGHYPKVHLPTIHKEKS